MKVRQWIEAMRLRTLPVSVAGVLMGSACAAFRHSFRLAPALGCLLFAVLAQIASNFGNEYYDFKNGMDRKGRAGFRRGVTEGDITPGAMKYATYGVLAAAGLVGLVVAWLWGGWWMIPVGLAIAVFAIAYSAGPYPLSHHGLGDIAVVLFFGFVPVTLTCWLQTHSWEGFAVTVMASAAIGLMAANVLVVNNYRDLEDDASVGKKTTCVLFGRTAMGRVYLLSGVVAVALTIPLWVEHPLYVWLAPTVYLLLHLKNWKALTRAGGSALNPLLGKTALNLLVFSVLSLAFGFAAA